MRGRALYLVIGAISVAVAAGIATAGIPSPGGVIDACYERQSGQLRVYDVEDDVPRGCRSSETPIQWSQMGPSGPSGATGPTGPTGPPGPSGADGAPGTFSGVFESPNEEFSLSVTDDGIELEGPGGRVEIDGTGMSIDSAGPLSIQGSAQISIEGSSQISIQASSQVSIEGSGQVSVNGSQVRLNGCSSWVARAGDLIGGTEGGGVVTGSILGGSGTVCAG